MQESKKASKTQVDTKSIIGLVILITAFYFIWPFFQSQLAVKPLPQSSFQTMQGDMIDLHGHEQPSILFFWATWCEICKVQMPDMQRLEEKYKVLYISADSGSDRDVLRKAAQEGLASENLINDPVGIVKDKFGVVGYPSVAIVKDNQIRFFKVGYMRKNEIESILDQLVDSNVMK